MFNFHKPKMYRSIDGCCICRAKSSSSRFTDSNRYEMNFKSCFGLGEMRCGDICNACVLLVKRWKKLPAGSKKDWNHVVDAKAGSSMKATLRTKKIKKKLRPKQISRVQSELKRNNSDAHSTTSSASPAQSPTYSNQSDEGSDMELSHGSAPSQAFSFLDLTYWKRQKVCCGIVYKGRYGEIIIDPHLFKPCCQRKPDLQVEEEMGGGEIVEKDLQPQQQEEGEESGEMAEKDLQQQQEEMEGGKITGKEENAEQDEGQDVSVSALMPPVSTHEVEEEKEELSEEAR